MVRRLMQDPLTGEVLPSELERLVTAERGAALAADYQLADIYSNISEK